MRAANLIEIKNEAQRDVILWPKKKTQDFAILIKANESKLLDLAKSHRIIDLDKCYFRFESGQKKIQIHEADTYKIYVRYGLV